MIINILFDLLPILFFLATSIYKLHDLYKEEMYKTFTFVLLFDTFLLCMC